MARELVYTGFVSLDRVVGSPGGTVEGHRSGGRLMDTDSSRKHARSRAKNSTKRRHSVFGQRSYEAFAPVWHDYEDHSAYNDLPKRTIHTSNLAV